MTRFVICFSYMGSKYSGMQRQLNAFVNGQPNTIQDCLESAIKSVWYNITPKLTLSSRTDKGVHALANAAHVDLNLATLKLRKSYWPKSLPNDSETPSEVMVKRINSALNQLSSPDIRVNGIYPVPYTFHARHSCQNRTYVYRIAKVKEMADVSFCTRNQLEALLPAAELCRCFAVGPSFDVDAFTDCLDMFNGVHDFATFVSSTRLGPLEVAPTTTRALNVHVTPGRPFMSAHHCDLYDNISFYDVNFMARSFLYKQLRHLMGAAIAVGRGNFTLDQVKFLLDNPHRSNWPVTIIPAPPGGLFLTNLYYRPADLEMSSPSSEG